MRCPEDADEACRQLPSSGRGIGHAAPFLPRRPSDRLSYPPIPFLSPLPTQSFEYTDDDEPEADDTEVALENAYYNAKGLRETDLGEAEAAFEEVLRMEAEEIASGGDGDGDGDGDGGTGRFGPWSYKALKQLVKIHLGTGNAAGALERYRQLLRCVASGSVSPNAVEKGANGMLERVSALVQGSGEAGGGEGADATKALAREVYDATLRVFHPQTGPSPNERLWFKTNLKFGQLLYEMNETAKLQLVIRDLLRGSGHPDESPPSPSSTAGEGSGPGGWGGDGGGAAASGGGPPSAAAVAPTAGGSTNLMEIYALQIQLYSRQKDNKKLREIFGRAMRVQGGIPHPRTLALIQELGGKMHMASREFEAAGKTFFQAFKSYDEAGDPARLRCLKYLVLSSMLGVSSINPFDSQEARPYRDDPEITAMTNLVQAFHANEIKRFEGILRRNDGRIMDDEFVREHLADLLRTIRTQVLRRVIGPYERISLRAIARELNGISVGDVESLLVGLILDGRLRGRIDQVSGVLHKTTVMGGSGGDPAAGGGATRAAPSPGPSDAGRAASSAGTASSGATGPGPVDASIEARTYGSIDRLAGALEGLTMAVASAASGGSGAGGGRGGPLKVI